MKNAAFIQVDGQIHPVYGGGRKARIESEFNLFPEVLTSAIMAERSDELKDIQYLFSTWGMEALNHDQIALLPSLEAVFYGAGTVQKFARPFLEAGVKVVSAWGANAIPVAEYTVAQILLANKGFFKSLQCVSRKEDRKKFKATPYPGNYDTCVALLGAGMIGRAVIERLKPYTLDIIVFDPFLSDADAANLGVEKVDLESAFKRAFVVSNHLANLPATVGMLTGDLFASLPQHATFINTGRGATVQETAMIEVLQSRPDITAVLDVTFPEPPEEGSPLYTMKNVILTPHIAGSTGQEIWRLADFMIDEAIALREGIPLKYEVTINMLERMA